MSSTATKKQHRVTLQDYGTSILAAFAALSVETIPLKRLDAAYVKGFQILEKRRPPLSFYMIVDELHGDSPTAREAILGAVERGCGYFSDGYLHITIPKEESDKYIQSTQIPKNVILEAANEILLDLRSTV